MRRLAPLRPAAAPASPPFASAQTRMILAATLVAAVLRLWGLGSQSLWVDEVFTWMSAGGVGPFGWREVLENVHGPLYSAAVHAAMRLLGDSEWVLRLPGALAGIAMVPAMAWAAGRWAGERTAVAAAWLTAGSPFLVWYSQEARNYAWVMLAAALAAGTIAGLRHSVSTGRLSRLAAFSLAGLLSNLSFALLLPSLLHAAWFGPQETRAKLRRAVLMGAAVVALGTLPWLPQVASTWDWSRLRPARAEGAGEQPLRGSTTYHLAAIPYAFHTLAVGPTLGPSPRELKSEASLRALRAHAPGIALAAVTFTALAALGLASLGRRRRLADTLLAIVVPAAVVSYFALQNFKVFHPRYLAVSMPWVIIVFAAGFAEMRGRSRLAIAGAVGALWGLSLWHLHTDPGYRREDYRAALTQVRRGFSQGEQVVAVGSEEPVLYYGRGLPVTRWWLGHVARPDRMQETWRETLARARGSWVVLSRSEDLDPDGRFARWMEEQHPEAPPQRLAGVTLWHLTDRDAAPNVPSRTR